ncbi:hypothetical protein BDN71DRAFT_427088 [Pleurotus eryngii]|uniref:Uncharacterized protein n=1 Tax=Pleurotus eryngii TaxID=5323 RepID=A0A9P6DAF9_PLEER|nr:hypothetical protein BDN71DRAFT_427088 [Pleurotus eryngii]
MIGTCLLHSGQIIKNRKYLEDARQLRTVLLLSLPFRHHSDILTVSLYLVHNVLPAFHTTAYVQLLNFSKLCMTDSIRGERANER